MSCDIAGYAFTFRNDFLDDRQIQHLQETLSTGTLRDDLERVRNSPVNVRMHFQKDGTPFSDEQNRLVQNPMKSEFIGRPHR